MPATTHFRGKPSATTIYKPTRSAKKTYGRSRPKREMKQETLTQMDFTSSAMRDFIDLDDDDEQKEVKEEKGEEDEEEETIIELEPPRPAEKAKAKAKSRNNRRKTAGEEVCAEEKLRKSKRRKTLGDLPNSSPSSSYHTQTLTQMMAINDREEDPWRIEDSQDLEDSKLVMETPRKPSSRHGKENIASAVPSLVQSVTPANRQKRTEVPSSNTPRTPILLRYSPPSHHSPLMAKSTNVAAPSPILKPACKWSKDAVVPDSYSTAHESSPVPSQKSTVKATPSKRLRFSIPEDKENITPGRTKPKSPKPKSQPTGRRPLQEVPDSDEDLDEEDPDETEYETEEDEFGTQDPESPTPKRFQNISPVKDMAPELEPSQLGDHPPEEAIERVVPSESRLPSHELGLEPYDEITSIPDHESAVSSDSDLEARDPHLERPDVVAESHVSNQELDQEPSIEAEAQTPETPRANESAIDLSSTSAVEQIGEPSPPEQDENEDEDDEEDDEEDELSPSQSYLYTQGLESQRLPLDSIRALGPQTPHSDIMVSLHPEHIAKIVDRTKNHEFRVWKIPQQVSRIWIYITRPECELKYMCRFGEAKLPGEIEDDKGVGNIEFNQGKKSAKFAYEVLQVYELNNPVSLDEMKRKGWVKGPPQKYTYIPPAVVGELTANLRCALFEDKSQSQSAPHQDVSESQELKAQLQSDADYSTQHYSEETMDEIIPASQTPRKDSGSSKGEVNTQEFARPALSRILSTSSNPGLPPFPPFPPSQRQRNFVRASQATTVSQASSSPAITTPGRSGRHPIPLSSSSPTTMRRIHSSIRSSQFPTTSQMLPDSLLNDDIQEPPPIIWDSADEHSD
ncbi:hypothetical protein F4679DRAFT_528256 [Xylaria curta]|nr:hypothetical protein F4679DRAFT_528256 [Xylaria curta]